MRQVPKLAWALLLAALLIRLIAVQADLLPLRPSQDSSDYERHARSIAAGDGFPSSILLPGERDSAFRAPAYPYFLGATYKLSGGGETAARYVQALVGTGLVALIGLLAWQLAGRRVGLASMGVAAIYPPLVAVGTAILTEAIFVPLELGALVAVLQHRRSQHRYRWALLAGVLAGLTCLARPNGALILVPLLIAAWPSRRAAAALLAAALLVVVPWTIRNAAVLDHFVPVSTEGGYVLAGMYNDAARTAPDGKAIWRPTQLVPEYAALFRRRDLDEVRLEQKLRSGALRDIRHHPGYVVEAGVLNTARLAHLIDVKRSKDEARGAIGLPGWLADASIYGFYPFALLALAGCATAAMRRVPLFVWLTPLLFLSSALVGGLTRYRAPIDPFIVILAGSALAAGLSRLQERERSSRASGPPSGRRWAEPGPSAADSRNAS